jgi:phage-related protein
MKTLTFIGGSDDELRSFPTVARQRAGYQLFLVQIGDTPYDSKAMTAVGPGCREIRIREQSGAFRVFFVASVGSEIYVLHCFQKKTQRTPPAAITVGKQRYQEMMKLIQSKGQR